MDSRLGLPVNTVLDGSYRIERVVGSGGFGITYEAEDVNLGTAVAIKEYYPFDFGDRDATMSVKPKSDRHQQTFDWGRSNFLQEARTLARFEHPSIVRVTRVFEANSTAYMVMRFEQGQSFEDWLRSLGRLPTQEELDSIVAPLLDALQMMHAENFLHRDIAPDNIIVRGDGTPVLLDFGAARRAVAEMSRTHDRHRQGRLLAARAIFLRQPPAGPLVGPLRAGRHALPRRHGTSSRGSHAARRRGPHAARVAGGAQERLPPGLPLGHRHLSQGPAFRAAAVRGAAAPHDARTQVAAKARARALRRGVQAEQAAAENAFQTAEQAPAFGSAQASQRASGSGAVPPRGGGRRLPRRSWPSIGGAYGGFEYTRWQPPEQVEAQRKAEAAAAKKKADDAAALRQQESKLAEENAFREAEARRQADAAAARKRADDERVRQEAEAKRVADAAAAAAAARKLAEEERARQDAEAKRLADAAAAKKQADDDRARQEAEAKRLAEAAAAKKKADDDRARQEAEAKRLAEAAAAKKKADDERVRQEAEAKRLADAAAARKKADDEAQAKREQEQRIASEKTAAADAARRQADADMEKSKIEDPTRVASITLNAQERTTFVKRVQEVLKQSKCYEGDINGSTDDAQKSLDRYVKTARMKGKEKPERIELAKASASDFDSWLREFGRHQGWLVLATVREEAGAVEARANQDA